MSPSESKLLEDLATALEYPGNRFEEKVALARERGGVLSELGRYLAREGKAKSEERYTRLFDLSPVCTLHLGYHLFGDAYERGELLAGLVSEVKRAGIELDGELPDFLPVMLRLLARQKEEDNRRALTELVLLPGLEKMKALLPAASDPWTSLILGLPGILRGIVPAEAALGNEVPTHA